MERIMVSTGKFPGFLRCAALFATAAVFAGPPTFGGGFHGGGFHGGTSVGVRAGSRPAGGWHTGSGTGWRGGAGGGWIGASIHTLPTGYATYRFGGSPYYYAGGAWYRPWNGWYLGCYPPIGLCFPFLPLACETFWVDGVRYYTDEDVYYTDAPAGGYQVAERPFDPEDRAPMGQPLPGSPDAAALDALLIVPEKGQDAARMKQDRDDAQRHAMRQSDYDPAAADPQDPGTPRARRAYLKALKDYLEARGYSVK